MVSYHFFQVGSVVPRRESHINVNVTPQHDYGADTPEIRKYKKRFNSEILCAALWGVNLLIGTENGLMLLDRWSLVLKLNSFAHSCILKSVWFWITQFYVINQTKYSFQVWPGQGLSTYKPTKVPTDGGDSCGNFLVQINDIAMQVLEGQNILVTISGKKNRVRVYYLSWLKSKILK